MNIPQPKFDVGYVITLNGTSKGTKIVGTRYSSIVTENGPAKTWLYKTETGQFVSEQEIIDNYSIVGRN